MLLRYVDHRIFDSAIVDLAPHLFSSSLGCSICVYELWGGQIRHIEEIEYTSKKLGGGGEEQLVINVLYIKEYRHFVPLLSAATTTIDQKYLDKILVNNNLTAQEQLASHIMIENGFYGSVARNLEQSILLRFNF